jgi:hypothetical protein
MAAPATASSAGRFWGRAAGRESAGRVVFFALTRIGLPDTSRPQTVVQQ